MMYPSGTDAEWFASDEVGHIARFTTGGVGPIPKTIVESNPSWFFDVEDLSVRSDVKFLQKLPRPDDFLELSKRGVYGFDWCDVHRKKNQHTKKYELISKPCMPIQLDEIGSFFVGKTLLVKLPRIRFQYTEFVELIEDIIWSVE